MTGKEGYGHPTQQKHANNHNLYFPREPQLHHDPEGQREH
jgi:hypothetical protein